MASSNRHWPSMFKSKSKPCNPNHHFHYDSLISSTAGCNKTPYTSGCDEKTPEPKARWNPKAEQIRILEAIFNSGMVNPPRDEIRKIRIQLQEYGQVGDANVFYWFQNRKSRSKHKLRNLNKNNNPAANSSSSSSSSDKSSLQVDDPQIIIPPTTNVITDLVMPNSPTASVNQTFFQPHNDIINLIIPTPQPESFFFPATAVYHNNGQGGGGGDAAITTTQRYDFVDSELFHPQQPYPYGQQSVGPCTTNMLLSDLMMMSHDEASSKNKYLHDQDDDEAIKLMNHSQFISFCQASTTNFVPPSITTTLPSPITHQFQGVGDAAGTARSTVFINDVAFEVGVGPFNVREAFGDEAVLIQSSGHAVLTDEWGVTLYPLQHGASYYLVQ